MDSSLSPATGLAAAADFTGLAFALGTACPEEPGEFGEPAEQATSAIVSTASTASSLAAVVICLVAACVALLCWLFKCLVPNMVASCQAHG